MTHVTRTSRLRQAMHGILKEALLTSWELAKIMVPVSIITRILAQLGVVEWLGTVLTPCMKGLGLPGEIGFVWATAMLTNLYGGLAAFASLSARLDLTVAQATVACVLMLVAHTMPVELRVAQKAGARLLPMLLVRVLGALSMAGALHLVYRTTGYLQQPNHAIVQRVAVDPTWAAWAVGTVQTLLMIFVIVVGLLILMRLLEAGGVTRLMTRLLEPLLETIGMSPNAAPLTIIGITLGLSYGGGLIIRESQAGHLSKQDVVYSLTAMGLSHALIEDTLLMMALGGHISGVLWGRLLFTLIILALFVAATRRLTDARFAALFYRTARDTPTTSP